MLIECFERSRSEDVSAPLPMPVLKIKDSRRRDTQDARRCMLKKMLDVACDVHDGSQNRSVKFSIEVQSSVVVVMKFGLVCDSADDDHHYN